MGNFLELMKLRANDNNILNRYFLQKEKSFRYVTGTHTNEFINLMAAFETKNTIKAIQSAGIYSLLMKLKILLDMNKYHSSYVYFLRFV